MNNSSPPVIEHSLRLILHISGCPTGCAENAQEYKLILGHKINLSYICMLEMTISTIQAIKEHA